VQHDESLPAPAVSGPRSAPPANPVESQDAARQVDEAAAARPPPTQAVTPPSNEGAETAGDDHKMFLILQRAARRGNHDAQFALGRMYEHGKGVARDPVEAVAWFRRAAAGGNEQARRALARLRTEPANDEIGTTGLGARSLRERPTR
jgi:TPR repeat protein